jgi:anti-sigma factor RsiW
MIHPDEDTLLKLVLETLDEAAAGQAVEHLAACEPCRAIFNRLKADTVLLGSFDPPLAISVPPLPKAKMVSLKPFLRAAAILIIGFSAGFLASEWSRPQAVVVVEQSLVTHAPPDSIAYAACDQTAVRAESY